MGTFTFIGLGLHDEMGMSLNGFHKAKQARRVYVERYTNLMPHLSMAKLEELLEKRVVELSRKQLEEEADIILRDAEAVDIALLVPGDPMIATTHVGLRLEASRRGIKTEIVNGPSIYSAAPAVSGLQAYKFGRTVTIPFPSEIYRPETPYEVIKENDLQSLHSLVLLDVDAEKKKQMKISEGLEYLLKIEAERKEKIVTLERLAVGIAGVGSPKVKIKGDKVKNLLRFEFGEIPQTLIFPGRLHFMEAEALRVFAETPEEALKQQ